MFFLSVQKLCISDSVIGSWYTIVPCQGYSQCAAKWSFVLQNVLLFLILLNNARREDGSFHQTHILTFLANHECDMIFQSSLPKYDFGSFTVGDFSLLPWITQMPVWRFLMRDLQAHHLFLVALKLRMGHWEHWNTYQSMQAASFHYFLLKIPQLTHQPAPYWSKCPVFPIPPKAVVL